MTEIHIDYLNYAHGGMIGASTREGGAGYDFTGLVRLMANGYRWPDIFVLGEGEHYEFAGGAGMWGAAGALRAASGPAYLTLPGSLPRQWGPVAPVVFVNPARLIVERWYDHRAPDFRATNRNLLVVRPADGGDALRLVAVHGDLNPLLRESDAHDLRRHANDEHLCLLVGDWNETLSGPDHELRDLNDPTVYDRMWRLAWKIAWRSGQAELPYRSTTAALDYLCGYWDADRGERVGGVGFQDVCELAGVLTPTTVPKPNGRQCSQIDHMLANGPLASRVVPDSVRVHPPRDPGRPDSDHNRLSVTVRL